MSVFEHFMPTHLHFGRGQTNQLGEICAPIGYKALLVTYSSPISELLQRTTDILHQSGIETAVFDRVPENPLTTTVEEGVAFLQNENCDFVIGLGGGSVIDTAKGIAFSAVNPGSISDYIFGKPGQGGLPVVAVTTTAGTGTEADSLAVLTNPETFDKKSLKSPYIYPLHSIIDSELMSTLPRHLIAATGFDALCHAIEAFISRGGTPITDLLALQAIRDIFMYLPRIVEDPHDLDAWDKVAMSNTFGGMVLDRAGVVLVHGLEHPVSGLYNVRHGEGLAALLIPCLAFSLADAQEKFDLMARAMGSDSDAVSALASFMDKLDLNYTLSKLGVQVADLDWLTDNSMRTMTYAIQNNPRIPSREEIKDLYLRCM